MRHGLIAVGIAAALMLSSTPTQAKNDKPGPPDGAGSQADIGVNVSVVFEADETRLIRDYFATNPLETKPLPPGIAKNLARGKPLPPGIAKRYLPRDLASRLPMRADYERLIAGDDVLLVSLATGVIVDILTDAL